MRCITAKANELLRKQASEHYLKQGKSSPDFTFMSLENDDEPYPLAEVIFISEKRIAELAQRFKEDVIAKHEQDGIVIQLSFARKQLDRLRFIQNKDKRK